MQASRVYDNDSSTGVEPGPREFLSSDFGRNRPRLRYDFKIVDINGVAQGNEYWNAASQMPPITLADAAKLFSQ